VSARYESQLVRPLLAAPSTSEKNSASDYTKEALAAITHRADTPIPKGLPIARFETYQELVRASLDGRLKLLSRSSEGQYRAITLRFGIFDGSYRTLQLVGDSMGQITKERVRQLEEGALAILGISED
jgi:hypothetical protein